MYPGGNLLKTAEAYEILVMEAGRVVERGSHPQLLALGGRYARMWQLQNAGSAPAGHIAQENDTHGHQMA